MNLPLETTMTKARNLVERDLFRSYWDDGLLDLLCGLALLVTGLGWTSELGALAAIHVPLWVTLWAPLRRSIVEPRAGFVRFSSSRRKRNATSLRRTLALGIGTLVLLVVVYFVRGQQQWALPALERSISGLPAVLVAFAASLTGILTGALRFQVYGLVLLAAAAVTVWLDAGPAMPLVAGGALVVISGTTLLARFVSASRQYEESR